MPTLRSMRGMVTIPSTLHTLRSMRGMVTIPSALHCCNRITSCKTVHCGRNPECASYNDSATMAGWRQKSGVCMLQWFSNHGWMEVFQTLNPKHSPRGWLGYLGGWMSAMGHMVLMAWGCHDGRWCDVKLGPGSLMCQLGAGSLACHSVVTTRASRGSAAGKPGPDPRGANPTAMPRFQHYIYLLWVG